jgi:histidinol-phosphate/aromatic aminotransferase/cobyric acid decarboxylase-like protein
MALRSAPARSLKHFLMRRLSEVVFVCLLENPTGKIIAGSDILFLLQHPTWIGVVVVDEA